MSLLFSLRVAGQLVVAVVDVGFLPPFDEWQSGLLPYPLLVASQIAILIAMAVIINNFIRGHGFFVTLGARTSQSLRMLATVYFVSMIVRYIAMMALYPELLWFTGTIPIWFHFVLAGFLYTLGHYQIGRDEIKVGAI